MSIIQKLSKKNGDFTSTVKSKRELFVANIKLGNRNWDNKNHSYLDEEEKTAIAKIEEKTEELLELLRRK